MDKTTQKVIDQEQNNAEATLNAQNSGNTKVLNQNNVSSNTKNENASEQSWTTRLGNTLADFGDKLLTRTGETLQDMGSTFAQLFAMVGAGAMATNTSAPTNYQQTYLKNIDKSMSTIATYNAENNFTQQLKNAVYKEGQLEAATDDSWIKDMGETGQNITYGVAEGVGGMLPAIALSAIGGGSAAASKFISLATMGSGAFGTAQREAITNGANIETATAYGFMNAAVEVFTELMFGGIKINGKVIGSVEEGVESAINKVVRNTGSKIFLKAITEMGGEAIEEAISEAIDPFLKKMTYDPDAETFVYKDENGKLVIRESQISAIAEAALIGALTAGVLNSATSGVSKVSNSLTPNSYNKTKTIESLQLAEEAAESAEYNRSNGNYKLAYKFEQERNRHLAQARRSFNNISESARQKYLGSDLTSANQFKSAKSQYLNQYFNQDGSAKIYGKSIEQINTENATHKNNSQLAVSENLYKTDLTKVTKDIGIDPTKITRADKITTSQKELIGKLGKNSVVFVDDDQVKNGVKIDSKSGTIFLSDKITDTDQLNAKASAALAAQFTADSERGRALYRNIKNALLKAKNAGDSIYTDVESYLKDAGIITKNDKDGVFDLKSGMTNSEYEKQLTLIFMEKVFSADANTLTFMAENNPDLLKKIKNALKGVEKDSNQAGAFNRIYRKEIEDIISISERILSNEELTGAEYAEYIRQVIEDVKKQDTYDTLSEIADDLSKKEGKQVTIKIADKMDNIQKHNSELLTEIAKKVGLVSGADFNVVAVDCSTLNFHGCVIKNTMYIQASELSNLTKAVGTLAHEITHFAEGTKEYKDLIDYVKKNLSKKFIRKISEGVQRDYSTSTRTNVYKSELNARLIEEFIKGNTEVIEDVIKEKPKTAKSFYSKFIDVVNKVLDVFGVTQIANEDQTISYEIKSIDNSEVKIAAENLSEVKTLWSNLMANAGQEYLRKFKTSDDIRLLAAVRGFSLSNGSRMNNFQLGDVGVKYNYKAFEADKEAYIKKLSDCGMEEAAARKLIDDIDSKIVAKIKQNLNELDYSWDENPDDRADSPIKPNSDALYKWSIDFSTLCRKRLLQQSVITKLEQMIQTNVERPDAMIIRGHITEVKNQLQDLNEDMRFIEVACGLCYVESARLKAQGYIKDFLADPYAKIKRYFKTSDKTISKVKNVLRESFKDVFNRNNNTTYKNFTALNRVINAGKVEGKVDIDELFVEMNKNIDNTLSLFSDNISEESADYETYNQYKTLKRLMDISKFVTKDGSKNVSYKEFYNILKEGFINSEADLTKEQALALAYAARVNGATEAQVSELTSQLAKYGIDYNSLDNSRISSTIFTSPEGLKMLAKTQKTLFAAYKRALASAARSKVLSSDVWYRQGDIEKTMDKADIDRANSENGTRTQSWSGFQIIHILDYIGAIMDASANQMKMQAYTKVPDYVRLMGKTGTMINLSLIPALEAMTAEEFDSTEGMDFKIAQELRDTYAQYVGTIAIGINEKQIKACLASGLIDYVIPYHASGMPKNLAHLMSMSDKWQSYQLVQEEKPKTKDHGAKISFSEWFNDETIAAAKEKVGNNGYKIMQELQNVYLNLCEERGFTPKFSEFANEENYWKLLIDRKMVNHKTGELIIQEAVKPEFDFDAIDTMLNNEIENYAEKKAQENKLTRQVLTDLFSFDENGNSAIAMYDQKANKRVSISKDVADQAKAMLEKAKGYFANTDEAIAALVDIAMDQSDSLTLDLAIENIDEKLAFKAKNTERSDRIQYSYSKNEEKLAKIETSYNEAVANNDLKTAKKLVGQYAKAKGYTKHMYHGTGSFGFTIFNTSEINSNMGSHFGSKYAADGFAEGEFGHGGDDVGVYEVYLKANNPFETFDMYADGATYTMTEFFRLIRDIPEADSKRLYNKVAARYDWLPSYDEYKTQIEENGGDLFGSEMDELLEDHANDDGMFMEDDNAKEVYKAFREALDLSKYDSLTYLNDLEDDGRMDFVIQHPEQIKSADAIVYDDNGKMIPLSERFNDQNPDIRYSYTKTADYSIKGSFGIIQTNEKSSIVNIVLNSGLGDTYLADHNIDNLKPLIRVNKNIVDSLKTLESDPTNSAALLELNKAIDYKIKYETLSEIITDIRKSKDYKNLSAEDQILDIENLTSILKDTLKDLGYNIRYYDPAAIKYREQVIKSLQSGDTLTSEKLTNLANYDPIYRKFKDQLSKYIKNLQRRNEIYRMALKFKTIFNDKQNPKVKDQKFKENKAFMDAVNTLDKAALFNGYLSKENIKEFVYFMVGGKFNDKMFKGWFNKNNELVQEYFDGSNHNYDLLKNALEELKTYFDTNEMDDIRFLHYPDNNLYKEDTFDFLADVEIVLKQAHKLLTENEKAKIGKRTEEVTEMHKKAIEEQNHFQSVKGEDAKMGMITKGVGTIVDPRTRLHLATGFDENGEINSMYEQLVRDEIESQRKFAEITSEISNMLNSKKFRNHLEKEKIAVKTMNGEVMLTYNQAIDLYLMATQENAKRGFEESGFTYIEKGGFMNKKSWKRTAAPIRIIDILGGTEIVDDGNGKAVERKVEGLQFSEEDTAFIEALVGKHTTNENGETIDEKMGLYDILGDLKYSADMEMNGVSNVLDKYYPLKREQSNFSKNLANWAENGFAQTLYNILSNKDRNASASSALNVGNAYQKAIQQAQIMTKYAIMGHHMDIFGRMLGISVKDVDGTKVRVSDVIGNYDEGFTDYIVTMMADMVAPRSADVDILSTFRSHTATATLVMNVKALLSQLTSLPAYFSQFEFKDAVKGMVKSIGFKTEMMEKSAYAQQRYATNDVYKAESGVEKMDKVMSWFMKWYQAMDRQVLGMVYEAAKSEAKRKGISDANFDAYVENKFVDAGTKTQPQYLQSQRSAFQRSPIATGMMVNMYKAVPTKYLSMMADSIAQLQYVNQEIKRYEKIRNNGGEEYYKKYKEAEGNVTALTAEIEKLKTERKDILDSINKNKEEGKKISKAEANKNSKRIEDIKTELTKLTAELSRNKIAAKSLMQYKYAFEDYDPAKQRKSAASLYAAKSVGAVVFAQLLYALLAQAFKKLYHQEDEDYKDENYNELESFYKNLAIDLSSSMLGMIPMASEIFNYFMKDYEIENLNYQMVNNMLSSTKAWYEIATTDGEVADAKYYKALRDSVYAASNFLGLPVKNVTKMVMGLASFDSKVNYSWDNLFNTNPTYAKDIAWANRIGDTDLADYITKLYLTSKGVETSNATTTEIARLYASLDSTKKSSVLPRSADGTYSYNGEDLNLTKKENERFKSVYNGANESITNLMKLSMYNKASDEIKAKAIKKVYDTYYNLAIEDYLDSNNIAKNDNTALWAAEYIGIEKFSMITAKCSEIKDKKNAAGVVESRKTQIMDLINRQKLSDTQKYMLLGYLGYTNTAGYQQVRTKIFSNKSLTYAQKLLMLEKCGYKNYLTDDEKAVLERYKNSK